MINVVIFPKFPLDRLLEFLLTSFPHSSLASLMRLIILGIYRAHCL